MIHSLNVSKVKKVLLILVAFFIFDLILLIMRTLLIKFVLILLVSYSLFMMLILLNYLSIGYNFLEYVYFIKWYVVVFLMSSYILIRI